MTGGSFGTYQMQGKCLSHGKPCGDGFVYQYGIVCVSANGYSIEFDHYDSNFDQLYDRCRKNNATLFFLPSIFRNGQYLSSNKTVDKVLIRRETHIKVNGVVQDDVQMGVILFDQIVTCDEVRQIVCGLDRQGKSTTTHIYVLDGGPSWGQSCKETNGQVTLIGTRNPAVVTSYLVFY